MFVGPVVLYAQTHIEAISTAMGHVSVVQVPDNARALVAKQIHVRAGNHAELDTTPQWLPSFRVSKNNSAALLLRPAPPVVEVTQATTSDVTAKPKPTKQEAMQQKVNADHRDYGAIFNGWQDVAVQNTIANCVWWFGVVSMLMLIAGALYHTTGGAPKNGRRDRSALSVPRQS
jgi:hypothetical protein